jgi:hypothetical protein
MAGKAPALVSHDANKQLFIEYTLPVLADHPRDGGCAR